MALTGIAFTSFVKKKQKTTHSCQSAQYAQTDMRLIYFPSANYMHGKGSFYFQIESTAKSYRSIWIHNHVINSFGMINRGDAQTPTLSYQGMAHFK